MTKKSPETPSKRYPVSDPHDADGEPYKIHQDGSHCLPRRGGRPKKGDFGEDRLLEICARVALGETLTKISREPGQPTPAQFRSAVLKSPSLSDAWDRAKAERPHSLFEEAIDMARELKDTTWERDSTNQVRALQIAIDALRTAAARLAPQQYGERPQGQVVVPVQINTTLALDGDTKSTRRSVYQIEAALPTETT